MKQHKLLNLATIAALSATVFAGAPTVFAEDGQVREITTEGDITFVEGSGDEPIEVEPPVDPEEPIIIPPVEPETNRGPLTIAYVPNISFGERAISAYDQEYNAIAPEFAMESGEGTLPYIHFAQVQDTRGTYAGWDLTVSLTEFTNSEASTVNKTLRGAQLNFKNGLATNNGLSEQLATAPDNVTLRPGQEATNLLSASEGKGAGIQSIYWGELDALNTVEVTDEEGEIIDTYAENPSVTLDVPGATEKDQAQYTATLTWNLTAGVANENPED